MLALAAVLPLPQLAHQFVGQVVEQFLGGLGEQGDVPFLDPGFFPQFTQRRFAQVFAIVDPALGHLPEIAALGRLAAGVDPLADEDLAGRIDKHHAHAGTIG